MGSALGWLAVIGLGCLWCYVKGGSDEDKIQ